MPRISERYPGRSLAGFAQLTQLTEAAPSGPQWDREIKLVRMAPRTDRGRAQLLTRMVLDWTEKYPSGVAHAGEGRGEDGLSRRRPMRRGPSFSQIQSASDGERGVRLVYYAFDLLHLDGRDTSAVPLI